MKRHQPNIITAFSIFLAVLFIPSIIQATERVQNLNHTVNILQNQYNVALNDYNTFLSRNDIHTTVTNSKCEKLSPPERQKQQQLARLIQLKQTKERKLHQLERNLNRARKELHKKQMYHQMTEKQK